MAKIASSPWTRKTQEMASAREEKRLAVLRAGAREFRERGFEKTSLDGIARKLGVTKPTLYYYISDKEDIVYGCGMAAAEELTTVGKSISGTGSGLLALTEFFRRYVEIIAGDFGYCLAMIEETQLEEARASDLHEKKRETNAIVQRMLERGIRDGSIIDCDTKLVSFALFGAFNWIARWHRGAPPQPEYIAEVFTSLFVNGLGAKRGVKAGRDKRKS
jgi:AcrR family transcriptional regulator